MMQPIPSTQKLFAGGAMIAFATLMMMDPAFAAASGSAGSFRCSGGQAVGALYDATGTNCPKILSFNNIFSFLICNMEQLSSNLLGNMYCGVVRALAPTFTAVVTLAVMFQGITFTLGLNPRASARDLQFFLIKVAVITAFATQADYLIGVGYKFFINGIRDGTSTVLAALIPATGGATSGNQLYGQLDAFLGQVIKFATDYIGAKASGDTKDFCKNAIFAVMGIMAVAFPPIFYLGLLILFRIGITFLRAVFGYVYAIVGIAFLMVLSPFFLSFALFRQTQQFFEKWVGFMVSFALQVVLMFSFLTFVLLIDVKHISESLPNIIVYHENPQETTSFRFPWQYCTLCDFKICKATASDPSNPNPPAVTGANCDEIKPDTSGSYKDLIGKGMLVCKDDPPKPIGALNAMAPPDRATQNKITSALLTFAGFGLISLLVLAYVIEELLALIPSLAQRLASAYGGASYVPQIGGGLNPYGQSATSLPFEGLGAQAAGSYERTLAHSGDSITGSVKGVKNAVTELVAGRDAGNGNRVGGISDAFADWLSDPNRIDD